MKERLIVISIAATAIFTAVVFAGLARTLYASSHPTAPVRYNHGPQDPHDTE